MKAQWIMQSKIGALFLEASDTGVTGVYWDRQPSPLLPSLDKASPQATILSAAQAQLEEYLDGRRTSFDLPLDMQGTNFQKSVWRQLLTIPYGKTESYAALARSMKKDKAARAVGSANGKNPLCIIVPCHRVIASDGTLGGYSGGLDIKKTLLTLEQRHHS